MKQERDAEQDGDEELNSVGMLKTSAPWPPKFTSKLASLFVRPSTPWPPHVRKPNVVSHHRVYTHTYTIVGTQHPQTSIQTYTRTAWHHKAPSYRLIHIPSHQNNKPTIPLPLQGGRICKQDHLPTIPVRRNRQRRTTPDSRYIPKPDIRPPRHESEGKISQLDAAQ